MKDASLQDRIDANDWWTKLDPEGKKIQETKNGTTPNAILEMQSVKETSAEKDYRK